MTYNQKSGNPFTSAKNEWSSNNLLLKDPAMRAKAGVNVLDAEVTEAYKYSQTGGATSGMPFNIKNFGASDARPYNQEGGMPRKFYDNTKLW
jgi:hypothetical protein